MPPTLTPQPQGPEEWGGQCRPRLGRQMRAVVKSTGPGPCYLGDLGQVTQPLCLSLLRRRVTVSLS